MTEPVAIDLDVECNYCFHCGAQVKPYKPSNFSFEDYYVSGVEPKPNELFRCDTCNKEHIKPNLQNTGEPCDNGHHNPYRNDYCVVCGVKLRWAKDEASTAT